MLSPDLQCNCGMGLMPEIRRAWLTIDNTLYMWNYMDGKDVAYFDGLNQVIISVGLVLPKPGVFQDHIRFLLCLTTAVEVAILGVSFTGESMGGGVVSNHGGMALLKGRGASISSLFVSLGTATDEFAEVHLQPEPLFNLTTDNVGMMCIEGTPEGRIFLGGKDGSLYEVTYQAKDGWFSKRCQLVNQSVSSLAFLLPSFLSFTEEGKGVTYTPEPLYNEHIGGEPLYNEHIGAIFCHFLSLGIVCMFVCVFA